MENARGKTLMILGFALSMFTVMIPGIEFAFNVYALSLKETFNFTQIQVEITGSMGSCGLALTFLENVITSNFGYKATFLVTWVAVSVTSGLFSLSAAYGIFFHSWPVVIYVLQFLFSTSSSMVLVVITRVNVENLPTKHSAKVIGITFAMACAGKIMFGFILEYFFEGSLAGFFLTVTVASSCLLGVTYVVLYEITSAKETNGEYHHLNNGTKNYQNGHLHPDEIETGGGDGRVPARDMFQSIFFHSIFWTSALFSACAYTFVNNITIIAESEGFADVMVTVYVVSLGIIFTRIFFGFVFDKLLSLNCGFTLLMISYASLALASSMGMYVLNATTMYLITILVGIGLGASVSIAFSMLVLRFGQNHFGLISSLFFPVLAAFQSILQVFTGFAYDEQIRSDTRIRDCHGRQCFFWCFLAMLIVSLTVAVAQGLNCLLCCLKSNKES